MARDASSSAPFYQSTCGAVSTRLLRRQFHQIWPDLRGMSVLGLGYAAPYLGMWRARALSTIAAVPEHVGLHPWPRNHASLTCAVIDDLLPFADLSFDRILLIHELESTDNTRRLLREIWRVLKDAGRLLVVAPNRHGLWTLSESTPFGQGRPFSQHQLDRVLTDACFRVETRRNALFLPPTNWRFLLHTADLCERAGQTLVPRFAGALLAESVKDAYAAVPTKATRRLVVMEPI